MSSRVGARWVLAVVAALAITGLGVAQHQRAVRILEKKYDPATNAMRVVLSNDSGLYVTGLSLSVERKTPQGKISFRTLSRRMLDQYLRTASYSKIAPVNPRIEWVFPLEAGEDPNGIRVTAALFSNCSSEGDRALVEEMLVPRRKRLADSKEMVRLIQEMLRLPSEELRQKIMESSAQAPLLPLSDKRAESVIAAGAESVRRGSMTIEQFRDTLRQNLATRQQALERVEPFICHEMR